MSRVQQAMAAVIVVLGAVLAWQWWSWERSPAPAANPRGQAGGAAAPVTEPPAALTPKAAYAEIVERDLFRESRRAPEPAVATGSEAAEEAPAAVEPGRRPQLSLSGLVLTPTERYALVRTAAGEVLRLAEGDEYEGWRVTGLEPGLLLLAAGDRSERYALRDYPASLEAAPPPAKRQRGPRL